MPFLIRSEAEQWLATNSDVFEDDNDRYRFFELATEAKALARKTPDQPQVNGEFLTLWEIAYINKNLQGFAIERLAHGHTPKALDNFLDALVNARLNAFFHENDNPIPADYWLANRNKFRDTLTEMQIGFGPVATYSDESVCDNIPVLRTKDAGDWFLKEASNTVVGAVEQFYKEEDLERWYRDEYVPNVSPNAIPASDKRTKAIVSRDGVETGVKRDRARRIKKRHEPLIWSKAGRRPSR